MTNTVSNAVTHTVASHRRRTVQNQIQNQTLFRSSCGSSIYFQIQDQVDVGAALRAIGIGAIQ